MSISQERSAHGLSLSDCRRPWPILRSLRAEGAHISRKRRALFVNSSTNIVLWEVVKGQREGYEKKSKTRDVICGKNGEAGVLDMGAGRICVAGKGREWGSSAGD